jgi:hypothetical protein
MEAQASRIPGENHRRRERIQGEGSGKIALQEVTAGKQSPIPLGRREQTELPGELRRTEEPSLTQQGKALGAQLFALVAEPSHQCQVALATPTAVRRGLGGAARGTFGGAGGSARNRTLGH